METENAMLQPHRSYERRRQVWWASLSVLLYVVLVVLLIIEQTSPPSPVAANAPASQFSSARAMADMKLLTQEVHSNGTPGHDKVRDEIIAAIKKLGYDPELQVTTGFRQTADVMFDRAASVQNIVVRVKGAAGSGKAVLLATHYSTSLHSVGADEAVPVAALLETMRNLQAGGTLQQDVIFLFTDAKEPYPVGSQAFVEEHPWAKDVGLVFNFDVRGASGPLFMYETSEQNAGLIADLAQALPSAFANSFLYSLYKLTYYDTDFTFLKTIPTVEGLNFAFANDSQHYQNPTDVLANVDERSLQQTGEVALGLARYFGNAPQRNQGEGDAVFFNIGHWTLVHYPVAWVIPLDVVVALVLLGSLVYGLRQKRLGIGRLLLGLLMFVLTIVVAAGVAIGATMLVGHLTDSFALLNHHDVFMLAFLALTLAVLSTLHALVVQRLGLLNLTGGALLGWLLLNVAITWLVPAGSYLFTWPLLFASIGLFYLLKSAGQRSMPSLLLLSVLALPTLLLGAQITYLLYMLLTLVLPVVIVVMVALLGGLMIPHLDVIVAPRRWLVPLASMAAAIVLFGVGVSMPAYDAQNPKSDVLFYGYDADTGQAYFGSRDEAADVFTGQYIKNWNRTNFKPFFPQSLDDAKPYVEDRAPVAVLPAPQLQVVADEQTAGGRDLHVNISAENAPWNTLISMTSDQPLQTGLLNGKAIQNHDKVPTRWEILYYAPRSEGIDLVLHLKPGQQVKFHLVDGYDGLPPSLHIQRPAHIIENYFSDMSYVAKTFTIAVK